jgi:hypothetical protein
MTNPSDTVGARERRELSAAQAKRLRSLDNSSGAGKFTFRGDSAFTTMERLGLVMWVPTRGIGYGTGRYHITPAARAALSTRGRG